MPEFKVSDIFGMATEPDLKKQDSDLLISSDNIGVEIELEEVFINDTAQFCRDLEPYWKVERDDSLRGDRAYEFVFSRPMFGQDVVDALTLLCDKLNNLNPKPVKSDRCSVHVHLDMRNRTPKEISKITSLYLLCEEVFFSRVGASRQNNIYCERLYNLSSYLHRIRNVYSQDLEGFRAHMGINDKYAALNVSCLSTYGSIEFRHKEGCYDFNELISWINMILALPAAIDDNKKDDHFMTSDYVNYLVHSDSLEEFIKSVFSFNNLNISRDVLDITQRIGAKVCKGMDTITEREEVLHKIDDDSFDKLFEFLKSHRSRQMDVPFLREHVKSLKRGMMYDDKGYPVEGTGGKKRKQEVHDHGLPGVAEVAEIRRRVFEIQRDIENRGRAPFGYGLININDQE